MVTNSHGVHVSRDSQLSRLLVGLQSSSFPVSSSTDGRVTFFLPNIHGDQGVTSHITKQYTIYEQADAILLKMTLNYRKKWKMTISLHCYDECVHISLWKAIVILFVNAKVLQYFHQKKRLLTYSVKRGRNGNWHFKQFLCKAQL